MAKLRITIGEESYERPLDKTLCVAGRNPDLEIPIPSVSASREHFRIGKLKDGSWAIEDLNSTNGTFINGKRITKARLSHKDAIQIGKDCEFVFIDPPAPAPAPKKIASVAPTPTTRTKKKSGPIVVKSRAQKLKEQQEEERLRRREEKKKKRAMAAAEAESEAEPATKPEAEPATKPEAEPATAKESAKQAPAEEGTDIESEERLQEILKGPGGIEALLKRGETVRFGKYELQKKLSEGGMGIVFKAYHPQRGVVALKLLRSVMVDEDNIQRFKQEAWAISAFNHPNIVKVRDLGEHAGMHYIAMDFIGGEDLLAVGIRRELTYYKLTEILEGLASVLQLVHDRNIWHRDIKPQNILMDKKGEVRLIDFGIATIEREHDVAETSEGLIMGTPAFLSPEQAARGKMGAIDGRADLYSLGAVFYYLLTGRRPFTGRSALEILTKNMKEPPPHPHDIDHLIPGGLVDIALKLLEKNPADRYQSANELLGAIHTWRKTKAGRNAKERHATITKLRAKKEARQAREPKPT